MRWGLLEIEDAYSLAAGVKSIVDSASGGAISVKVSLDDHIIEGYGVRHGFHVSALIDAAGARGRGERRVIGQRPIAVNSVGGGDIERVAVGGDTKHDLVYREACGNPSIDSLCRRAGLKGRTRIAQRRVRSDTTGGPLTL